MVRTIPVINEPPSDHHLLSLSLLLTCMAAIIVISSAMCGTWSRNKDDGSEDCDNKADTNALHTPQDQQEATNDGITTAATTPMGSEGESGNKPLPPPPSAMGVEVTVLDPTKKRKPKIDKSSSLNNYISNKPSGRKLSTGSVSLRMPHGGLSMKHRERGGGELRHHHHHVHVHNIMRTKQEDSLWTKKILLGEKCKLHLDDEAAADSRDVDDKAEQVDSESVTDNDVDDMSRSDSSIDEDDATSSFGEKESERSSDVN